MYNEGPFLSLRPAPAASLIKVAGVDTSSFQPRLESVP